MNDFKRFDKTSIEQSLPERFRRQVRRDPGKIALAGDSRNITYRELDEWSNQIAHAVLAACGRNAEPVATLLDQGYAAVAAILGILKAGKLFLPLEPRDPLAELERTVVDGGPALIVTDAGYASLGQRFAGTACIDLDTLAEDHHPRHEPAVSLCADDLACIFYTSGSTGAPKGVFDCHRNVLHNVMRYTNNLRISPSDRLSLIQSCSFSGTASSLFSALSNGATLYPFNLHGHGIVRMGKWLENSQVTIFHSVPSIFDQLLSTGRRFPDLRVIRLEGDQSVRRHAKRFLKHFGENCVLANGLGTTETGLVRQFFVSADTPMNEANLPVGYEVEDMQVRLTGPDGSEVARGAVGQLTISSAYLALGYWQRPELTAAAFSADPEVPGNRLYRTGDLGRQTPDGCISYCGRTDKRAKIRGQRVEIADIESCLSEMRGVEDAIAVVREDRPGVELLVAYLVAPESARPTIDRIRNRLATQLPTAIVPGRFVYLDQLPLDRNGKVNRNSLPPPGRRRPPIGAAYVAPENFRQSVIAECLGEVLGLDEIGIHDNFFELGGDSLQATEFLMLLEQNLGVICTPEALFGAGTVAAIDLEFSRDEEPGCIINMQPHGSLPPLFCMHDAWGHVLGYRQLARLLAPEQPVFGVQCDSAYASAGADIRLEDIAKRYVGEIRKMQPTGPYRLCGSCFGGLVAFEVAQQLTRDGQQVALLALIDTRYKERVVKQILSRTRRTLFWLSTAGLSGEEKIKFVVQRCRGLRQWVVTESRIRLRALGNRRSRPAGTNDAFSTSEQIENRYDPMTYHGDVTLICPGLPHNQLGWRRFAESGLTVIKIPVPEPLYDPPLLVSEPHVVALADTMRKLLQD